MRRAFLLALTLGIFTTASAAVAAQPLRTGIFDPDSFRSEDPVLFERTRDSGASLVRILVNWAHVAPYTRPFAPENPDDPLYSWTAVDAQVRLASAHGLRPLLIVQDAPLWAQRCRDRRSACDPHPIEFGRFARALATRFSGVYDPPAASGGLLPRVRYYQAWNEPNLKIFFNPQRTQGDRGRPRSPHLYRALLNRFAHGVKAVSPGNRVVAAGLAPYGRAPDVAPLEFMRRLLCMEGRENPRPRCDRTARFDIWATHPYTTGGPTHASWGPDDIGIPGLGRMHELLRAADRSGQIDSDGPRVGFWVTEFSWDSSPPDPGGVPEPLRARWTAEALWRMWKAGVSAVFWFQLRDGNTSQPPEGYIFHSGLYLRGPSPAADRAKLTLRAFRFPFYAVRTARGVYYWGRTPSAAAVPVLIESRRDGEAWRSQHSTLGSEGTGIFAGFLPRDLGEEHVLRARTEIGRRSVPFSLRPVRDRYFKPFGSI